MQERAFIFTIYSFRNQLHAKAKFMFVLVNLKYMIVPIFQALRLCDHINKRKIGAETSKDLDLFAVYAQKGKLKNFNYIHHALITLAKQTPIGLKQKQSSVNAYLLSSHTVAILKPSLEKHTDVTQEPFAPPA